MKRPVDGAASARWAAVERAYESLDDDSLPVVEYIAVVGSAAVRELNTEGLPVTRVSARLIDAGWCTTTVIDGLDCLNLAPDLRELVLERLGDDRRTEILNRAATVREATGLLDCGLRARWELKDWDACGRILDGWGYRLVYSAYRPLTQRVLYAMPLETIRRWPGTWHRAEYIGMLPLGEAPVDLPSDPERIREVCRTGEARSMLRRAMVAMTGRRLQHRHDEAREIADRGRPIADAAMRVTHGHVREFCAFWYLQSGITYALAGDLAEANRLYRSGWLAHRADEVGFTALDLAGKLAACAAMRGESAEARRWLEEFDSREPLGLWVDPYIEVTANVARLLLAVGELEREQATQHAGSLEQAMLNVDEFWSYVQFANARRLVTWGDPHDALDALDDAARMNDGALEAGIHPLLWSSARADAMLAAGHATRAATELARLAGTGFGQVSSARLQLVTGDFAAARHEAGLALDGSLWVNARTELLLIDAAAAMALDDAESAIVVMKRALDRVIEHRDLRALATVPRRLLHELAPHVSGLDALVAQLDLKGIAPIYPESLELVSISPRERAVLEILAEGVTLAQVAKRLVVSPNTVKTQVRSLYSKLGVHTRGDLVREARSLGLLSDL